MARPNGRRVALSPGRAEVDAEAEMDVVAEMDAEAVVTTVDEMLAGAEITGAGGATGVSLWARPVAAAEDVLRKAGATTMAAPSLSSVRRAKGDKAPGVGGLDCMWFISLVNLPATITLPQPNRLNFS